MKIEDDHDDHDYDDHDYEEDDGDVMMTNTMLTGYTPTQTLQSSFPPTHGLMFPSGRSAG